ncbi:MAG: hypothetical protein WA718_08210 [Terriglobales bacterium]
MKLSRWISTAAFSLALLLGTGVMVQAQDEHNDAKPSQDEAKPNQPEPRHDATKPGQDAPARQGEAKPQEQNEDKPAREEKPAKQDNGKQDQNNQDRNNNEKMTNRSPQGNSAQSVQGNGNQRGGHIPDDKFRSSFGRQHKFKVQRPTVVQGQPTFQYGGYSFEMVDPWPTDWAYTDDCYIDYIDGEYFLFDLAHPGVRLAIVVVL